MSKKSLFTPADAEIRKKKVFMLRADLLEQISEVEVRAEKLGVSFPLNLHVEDMIAKLVRQAKAELADVDAVSPRADEPAPNRSQYDS